MSWITLISEFYGHLHDLIVPIYRPINVGNRSHHCYGMYRWATPFSSFCVERLAHDLEKITGQLAIIETRDTERDGESPRKPSNPLLEEEQGFLLFSIV